MAHKDRKTRRMRGSRTCGYGNTQKHRGAGSRGGRGMAGSKKHKWSWVSKYRHGYFGGRGFKRPSCLIKKPRTINIGKIDENIDKWIDEGIIEMKNGKHIIDLKKMNYDKLLGAGKITKPVVIKVEEYVKSALKKVKEAGGEIEGVKVGFKEVED